MVRRFWQTYAALSGLSVVVSLVCWILLRAAAIPLRALGPVPAALALPAGFPSLWDFALPAGTGPWLLWLVLLVVRTWLTGGMYGSLARVYAGLPGGIAAFVHDAGRAFWRLLLWQMLWDAVWLGSALWLVDVRVGAILWCARWVFLYANAALVCEPQDTARQALGRAGRAWLRDWAPALLLAAGLSATAAACGALAGVISAGIGAGPWTPLAVLLDAGVGVWLLHMTAARYAHVSGWIDSARRPRVSADDTRSLPN